MASGAPEIRAEPLSPRAERVRFCSRCAWMPEPESREFPAFSRVCARCGMGVYLSCTRDALGTLGTFFLVVGGDLRVGAVSEGAERVFGDEEELLGAPLGALISSPLGGEALARAVRRAAVGVRESLALPITPASREAGPFGPLEMRVSPCGPPRAALLAIEPALE